MNFGPLSRCVALVLAIPASAGAQSPGDSLAKHAVSLEIGGPGGLTSFNYEQSIRRQTFARVGLAKWSLKPWFAAQNWATTVIVGGSRLFDLSWLPDQHGTWIETGLNVSVGRHGQAESDPLMGSVTRRSGPYMGVSGELGFRFQGPGKAFSARFMMSPTYVIRSSRDYPRTGLNPGAGISFGFAF